MKKKTLATRKSLGLLSVAAISIGAGLLLAFASHKAISLAVGPKLCERYGYHLCLYTNDFSLGNGVYQHNTHARDIDFVANGGSFENHPTGVLKLTGATDRC